MTEFVILYTHQKQKKAKIWQDGILRVLTTGRKAAIYDDKNNKIDTIFLKNGEVSVGEEMESDRYLVQVECVRPDQNNAAPEQTPGSGQVSGSNSIAVTSVQPSSTGIRGSVKQVPRFVGLKRKKTGFNPPRLVKPKIEESVMIEDNLKPLRSELKHRPSFQIPRPLTEASSEGQYLSENNSFNTQGDVSEFLNVKKQVVKVETSMPSPWSIVGKSKLKTFQTGSRNNSQNDSQNSDSDRKEVDNFVKDGSQEVRHNPLFTSKKQEGNVCHIDDVNEVTEICEDKTSSKFALRQTGQNKLREKRSTSQILALIAETESTKGDMNDLTSSHTEYAQVGQQHAQNCVGENESETIMSERVGFTMCNDRRQQLQSTSVELDDGLNSEVSKETEGEKKKVEWKDSLNAITRSPQFGFQAFNTDRSDFNVKIVETSDCGESIGKSGFDVINVAGCSVIENSARQSAKDCSSVRTIDDSSQCKGDASRGSQVCNGAGEEANEAVNESCGQETEKTDLDTVLMDEEKCLRKRTDPSDYIHQRSILQSEDICDDIPSDFWEKNHLLTGSEPQKNKCTAKTDSTETRCFNIIEKSNVKVLDKRLDENSGRVETDEVDGASGQVGNYLSQRSEEGHVTGENNDNVEDELETACFDINFSPFSDDSFSDYETVACVEKEGESDELLFNTEKYIAPGSGSFEGDVNSDKVVGAECSMQHIRSNERNNSNVEKMLKGKDMACPAKKSSDGTFSSAKVNLDINKRKFNLTEHGNLATSSTQTVVSEHICKENRLKGSGDECVTVEIANSELAKSNIDYPSGYKENETSGSYAEDHVEKEGRSFSQESTTLKQDIGISLSQDQLIYVGQEKAENVLRISNLSVKDEKTDSVELASFANSSQFLPCNVVHQNNLSLANPVAAEKKELDSVEKSISGKFHVGGEQSRPELSKLIGKSSNEGKPMFTLSGLDLSPDDSQYGLGETDKQSLDERLFKTVQHSGIFSTVNEKTGYPEPWKIDTKPRSGNEEMIQDKKLVTLSLFEGIPAAEQIGALCSAKTCTHDNTVNTSEEVKIRPMLHDSSKKGSSYSMNYEKLDRTVDRYQENGINKNVIQHFSNAKSENNDVSVPAVDNVKNVANFPNVTNWEEMSDNWRSQTDSCRTSDTMFTYTSETESEEASQTQGIMGSVEKVSEVHTQDCRNIQREDLSQTMTPGVSGGRHGLLPHPSQLMGKTLGRVNTEQHYQGREERTDLLQAAQEKPVSYSVSGSVRSGTVRKRQEEMDEFNRDRVNADLVLEQMSSPDLESSQEHSLYPFNSDECIKKHFSHENLFMVTPKDVFSKRNVQKASPAQCVPESGDLDLGEKSCPMMTSVTNSLESRLKRVREPVKCQPFGDETRQQSGEVEKWYSQLSTERDGMPAIRSTPEHRKLPVWMSESPGDLSFTLSPYPDYKPVKSISYTDHRPPKCNPHTDQRPSSSHHMASQSTCISLVGLDSDSQEPLEEQKCIQVLRERREIESSSCSKFQALINTCSGTDALTTQTVHDQLVTQTQSLLPNSSRNMPDHGCSTSQIKLNSLRGSRWSRFENQSQEEKQETVPNKPYSISSRHETNYDHNLHSNSDQNPCESFKNRNAAQEVLLQSASVLYKSTNAPGKGTYVPIQGTGVDHLVCSSPPVKTEVELTSDLSTDNDSQCLSDVYFDIETPKQETKESDSLCASKVNRFAGSKRTDQICPQKYDTITHMGGDFDGKERVSEITGEVPRISRQFCNKANYLLGRPNMKRDRSKKYSPVPCINSKDIRKSDGNPCDTDRMDIRLNSNIIDSIEGQVPQKSHFRLSPVSCVGNTPGSDECPPVIDHCVEPYQLLASDRHCTQMYNSELSELRSHPVHGANDTKGMANLHRNALSKPFKKHVGLTYNPSVSVNSISTSEDPVGSVVPKTRDVCVQRRGFIPPRPSGSSCVNSSAGESRGFTVPASKVTGNSVVPSSQRNLCGDLHFPSKSEAEENVSPCRQITIPVCFTSVSAYKQVLKQALQEYLNVQLFELSKLYHSALSKLDLSGYTPFTADSVCRSAGVSGSSRSNNPVCEHGQPSKIVQVKKEGPNKGRFFFACNNARDNQCKFFKWADDSACGKVNSSSATTVTSGTQDRTGASKKLSSGLSLTDGASIGTFFKGRRLQVYCESIFLRKVPDAFKSQRSNATAWIKNRKTEMENTRKKLYIALSRKESSSLFAKDDLWVVSQKLTFDPGCTFVARSVFYGPSTSNEVEIEPLTGFCPSNWQNHTLCHAVHAGNVSSELMCLSTLQDFVKPTCLPVLPALLNMDHRESSGNLHLPRVKSMYYGPWEKIVDVADQLIRGHGLNPFQSEALMRVVSMFQNEDQKTNPPITLIHGVFGAGKSFLLAVIVKLIVKLSELRDLYTPGVPEPCKVLISSTTNVAVDRILLGLLDLGFDQFVRVGSVKKIAKPVLPYSMHATGTDSQEMKDLQEMMKSDISPSERVHIRKRIEKLRQGETSRQLSLTRVVGATCAACPFPSMKGLCFSVVILDECSQITEPASLLPIARFGCEKLILVGDPNQLDPTLEGSEAAHQNGLEQTLFDRLLHMGHEATVLRIQYRCHPVISAVANRLFYRGILCDGVSVQDRMPLMPGLPTLCFYDVPQGREMCERGGSFCNPLEAEFVVRVIETLVRGGVEASDIGVITLYKAQQQKISNILAKSGIADTCDLRSVQISTVDAFQGGERHVIILSCVRSNSSVFIDNDKRTNVALTRSKHHLLIVGNRRNLSRNRLWSKVIQLCTELPDGITTAEEFRKKFIDTSDKLSPCVLIESPTSPQPTQQVPHSPDEPLVASPLTETVDSSPIKARTRKRKLPVMSESLFDESDKENSSDSEDLPIGL